MPDEINKEALYNEWHKNLGAAQQDLETLTHPWYQTVMKLLPNLNGKRVLEIGAGRGDFSIWLAKNFPMATVVGTDFSHSAIEIAKTKIDQSLPNLSFLVENAENLSFSDESFDYIISCETMEHVFHPQIMANEMNRVLKKDGGFILTTENYFNGMILMWIKTWISGKPFDSGSGVQPHENFFTFFHIRSYFRKAGLKLTHTESNHFQFLMLPGIAPSKLCLKDSTNPLFKLLLKPFGRHYTYIGKKSTK
ncbi:MAG: class I SAM-dependent methyltransferase [Ferruginibacter sp.]